MNNTRTRLLAGLLCMALIFADVVPTGLAAQAAEVSQQASVGIEVGGGGNVTALAEERAVPSEGASDEESGEPELSEDQKGEESGEPGSSEDQKDEESGETESSEDQKGEESGEPGSSEDQKDEENGEPKPSEDQKDTEDGETGEEADEEPEAPAIGLPEGDGDEGTEEAGVAVVLAADETIVAEGTYTKNGSNTKWTIDGNGKLTVTGTGEVKDPGSDAPWYWERWRGIKTAVIKVSGMKDASRLFADCDSLVDLDVRGFDTSQVTNMSEMFSGCSSLATLDLSSFDTGQVTDMHEMLSGCSSLTKLDLSGFKTSQVTDMSKMFYNCSELMELDLEGLTVSSVTDMHEMFSGCSNLIELDLSSFGKSSVSNVESMFSGCSRLRKLDIRNFDTGSVKYMQQMFYGCSHLKDLDVSSFDTSSATDMREMFSGCQNLTELNLSKWNTGNVAYADSMLDGCSSLGVIDAPLYLTYPVTLPNSESSDGWRRDDNGETLTELPRNLEKSVRLTKSKEEVKHSGTYTTNDSDTKWEIDGDGNLTVTGTGDVKGSGYPGWHSYYFEIKTAVINVTGMTNASNLFADCNNLESVSISDTGSVTDMSRMFYGCESVTALDLSGFDTGSVTDMSEMFSGCSDLRSLNVSSFNTDQVTDMHRMFYDCSRLGKLDLSGFNTGSVTDMGEMLHGCSRLTTVDVSGFETSQVTDMHDMFSGCGSLAELNLSNLNADSVTDMSGMFSGCSNLAVLNLSGFQTGSVTDMSGMFSGCGSLTTLNLSGFKTNLVSDMGGMFSGCSSLTTLNVSGFETGSVTNMSGMFSSCSSLTTLDVSGFVTGSVTGTGMSRMFSGCSSLEALDASGFDTGLITDMSSMFSGCSSLTALDVSGFRVNRVTDMSGMFSGCSSLIKLDLRNWWMGNVTNAENMLENCSVLDFLYAPLDVDSAIHINLPHVFWIIRGYTYERFTELPQGLEQTVLLVGDPGCRGGFYTEGGSDTEWTIDRNGKLTVTGTGEVRAPGEPVPWEGSEITTAVIEVKGMKDASGLFKDCEWLISVDVSGFETDQVTDMSEMFSRCDWLTDLDVSGFNTSQVTDMRGMFFYCKGLTTLDVSGFNTERVTDMSRMFDVCSSLTELDVSGFDTGRVTDMNGMFMGCGSLTELDVSGFDTGRVTDMSVMFMNCSSLPTLDVSGFNTGQVTDMDGMFFGCSSLTDLDLRNWNMGNVTNTEGMLENCSSLTYLDLRNWNMGNVTNAENMLNDCTSLVTIFAPLNLKESVDLPKEKSNDVWYCGGKTVTQLPLNLSESLLLTRNSRAEAGSIFARKHKTDYLCGESVEITDLAVTYCRSDGSIIDLKADEYRILNIDDINKDTNTPGKKELKITYTDPDGAELSTTIELVFRVKLTGGTGGNITIKLAGENPVYNGYPQEPKLAVTVMMNGESVSLSAETDYTAAYANNIDAGADAAVTIEGTGDYTGRAETTFTIDRAKLIIQAADITIAAGDPMPADQDFLKEASGLAAKDEGRLNVTAFFTGQGSQEAVGREDVNTNKEGVYSVTLEADAGDNYEAAESRAGRLVIAAERVAYAVTFDLMGHGTNIEAPGILAGSLLDIDALNGQWANAIPREKDGEPVTDESGRYVFAGWYKDKTFAAKMKWDFDTDTVQADTTLYACWVEKVSIAEDGSGLQMSIQDIRPQYYTGSAIKPTVYVYAADGVTLLKSGKDYTITYKNNTNAVPVGENGEPADKGGMASFINFNKSGETKTGDIGEGTFNREMPYVIITGKGNYQNTICKNFQILPADISADDGSGSRTLAAGLTLKYSDQLVTNAKKAQNPFSSLKYKKAMKLGTDYEITLTAGDDVQRTENAAIDWAEAGGSAGTTGDGKTVKYAAPTIPKGYSGTFTMTVTGKGNYTGSFAKTVVVADKDHLLKNAKITLGKNQKNKDYDEGNAVTLTPGWYDPDTKEYYRVTAGIVNSYKEDNANDIFTVKAGKAYLVEGKDYTISYTGNRAAGTAAMTITGMGDYLGTKSVTFQIKGTLFNTKNIDMWMYDPSDRWYKGDFRPTMTYTGKAITQNDVNLTVKTGEEDMTKLLSYGKDYTISYKNNIKKGTATMTFTGRPESGYTGSFKKTFKITAVDISKYENIEVEAVTAGGHEQDSIEVIDRQLYEDAPATYILIGTVAYTREGAKPSAHIRIRLSDGDGYVPGTGIILKEGADYTVSYANNTAVKESNAEKPPTMTIKGKGNYTGSLKVFYTIGSASLENNRNITVSTAATLYNQSKPDDYEYPPKITVKDGKKTLSAKNDYAVVYKNNTQKEIREYLEELALLGDSGSGKTWDDIKEKRPYAVITAKGGSGYTSTGGITADLTIYGTKLTSSNLYVVVSGEPAQTTYTGGQVTPGVTVYCGDAAAVKAARKDTVTDEAALTKQDGEYRLTKLKPKTEAESDGDYTVTYGANIASGKNKGSVTITGAGMYGGSVTVKFEIRKRDVYHVSYNTP